MARSSKQARTRGACKAMPPDDDVFEFGSRYHLFNQAPRRAARQIRTSLKVWGAGPSTGTKFPQIAWSDVAVPLEVIAGTKVALTVEVVGNGGVGGGEHLHVSHSPEPRHRPLSSSERQVRVLYAIVQPAPSPLPGDRPVAVGSSRVPLTVSSRCLEAESIVTTKRAGV